MGNNNKVTFKPYDMNQLKLPIELEVKIPENHMVRIVNSAIDRMDLTKLISRYKGGGTSAYHPIMMLKAIVYAYTQKIYTSRQIAKYMRENINMMWICAKNTPNFRTINKFRSSTMNGLVNEIFSSVVELLMEEGLVKLDDYFLDGTKIEANANKYTYVWKKNVEKNKVKVQDKIKRLLAEIKEANDKENQEYGDKDLEELGEDHVVDPKKIDELVKKLNDKISQKPKKETKNERKILKTLKKDCIPKLEKYLEHEEKLNGRNSYSKTDTGATFMRMKEDHMMNGQLKPGYNVQIGTENQFILNYSVHQDAGDTTTLQENIEKFEKIYNKLPKRVIADSGYGSEENYEYLKEKEIEGYVKYNYFHKEQKRSFKNDNYRVENLKYDKETDEYICPNNKRLKYQETVEKKSKRGYTSTIRKYRCEDCQNCPQKQECTKGYGNRTIQINERLNELKQETREKLLSEEGRYLRGRRCCEVENVYGQIKWNNGFKRFLLRGLEKVTTEFGLICIAHNFRKLATV